MMLVLQLYIPSEPSNGCALFGANLNMASVEDARRKTLELETAVTSFYLLDSDRR
jgi:hypothetical protein